MNVRRSVHVRRSLTTPAAVVLSVCGLVATGTVATAAAPRPGGERPAAAGTSAVIEVSTAAELKEALTAVRPGDTVRLADGEYRGNFKATTPGTADAPITLTGSPDAVLTAGGGYGLHLNGASYWEVRGLTVTGGQKGVVTDAADHVVLDGITVHGLDMEAVTSAPPVPTG